MKLFVGVGRCILSRVSGRTVVRADVVVTVRSTGLLSELKRVVRSSVHSG